MRKEQNHENSDNLIKELDSSIGTLSKYKKALCEGDKDSLTKLLKEGTDLKKTIDGN